MEPTEKENAILCVLLRRCDCIDMSIRALEKEIAERRKQIDYLKAKREGYMQAVALIKEPIESINVEL